MSATPIRVDEPAPPRWCEECGVYTRDDRRLCPACQAEEDRIDAEYQRAMSEAAPRPKPCRRCGGPTQDGQCVSSWRECPGKGAR